MSRNNNYLGKSKSFFFARLGITVAYSTAIERIFLEACKLDPTIQHILRIPPYGGRLGVLPNPRRVAPAFVIVRPGRTEAVVLLNSSFVSERTLKRIDAMETEAARTNWKLKVWMPALPAVARAYRTVDKKRAGR